MSVQNPTSSQWRKLSLIPLAAFALFYKFGPADGTGPGLAWIVNMLLIGAAFYCLRRGMDVDRKPVNAPKGDETPTS